MSEVKRYDVDGFGGGMIEIEGGAWYHMADYEALAAECERLYTLNNRLINDGIKLVDQRDAALAELAALKGGLDELQAQKELMEQALSDLWSVRIDKIKSHCMDAAPPAQASAWVPEGWKLVPERMHLDSSDIETIQAHCGDGQEDAGFGPYSNGVLWIGECEEEDGSKTYGLHIATADYPEEGSSTLVEFAAAPTPGASDGKGGEA